MTSRAKSLLQTALFLSIGIGIMYVLYVNYNAAYQEDCSLRGIPASDCSLLQKIWVDFGTTDYKYIVVALVLFMVSNVSRVLRWHQLLEPLGYYPRFVNSMGSVMVAYLVNLGVPRSGEFVRAGVLSKYENYKPERVMGTIVTDRIIDVLSLIVVIALSMVLSYDTIGLYLEEHMDISDKWAQVASHPWLLLSVLLTGLAIVVVVWLKREQFLATAVGTKVATLVIGLWEGVLSIGQLKRPGLFIFHSVNIWLMYYLMTYICMFAFVPTENLGMVAALVVFVMGTMGFVFPAPGGMGAYHFMISQGLLIYGISEADGFSFANIFFFSVQLGCNVLFGILALVILPMYNRNKAVI